MVKHFILDSRTPSVVIRVMEGFKDLLRVRKKVRRRKATTTYLRDNVVRVAVVTPCFNDQVDAVLDDNLRNFSSGLV